MDQEGFEPSTVEIVIGFRISSKRYRLRHWTEIIVVFVCTLLYLLGCRLSLESYSRVVGPGNAVGLFPLCHHDPKFPLTR